MALLSFRQYAKYRGVSPEAVSKAVKTGRISTVLDEKGQRKIDPERADREWAGNSDAAKRTVYGPKSASQSPEAAENQPSSAPSPDGESAAGGSSEAAAPSYAKSRAIKEAYAARLAALDYQERLGKLISADKVRLSAFKTAQAVRAAILNVPNDLAGQLAAETDQKKIHILLTKALTEALEELSRAGSQE